MAKRGAETSLTKNNWQEEDEGDAEESSNQPTEASADKLAGRTFVKARRKPDAPEVAAEFNLAGATGAAPAFNFDFTKGQAAEAKVPVVNGFLGLIDPTNWECSACEVSNKKDLTKCAACETPRAGTQPAASAPVVPASSSSAPAPTFNAFQALMNPTNWECPACFVSNKKDLVKCASCEAPKPGSESATAAAAAAPAASGFTFGTASTSPFTFGSATTGTGGFSFGSSAPSWNFSSTVDSPFTFGSNAGAVTFGDVSGTTFGSGSPTSFEPTDQLATGGDQTKEEFKNKAPEPSGTEKDVTIFKMPTTVYLLSKVESKAEDGGEKKEAMKFVENGEGELKVNTIEDGEKKIARVVLRVEKTQRLVLNAPLFPGMTLGLQGDKYVKFASNDLEGKPAVYLLRFKNKTETTQVKEHMEKAIAFVG